MKGRAPEASANDLGAARGIERVHRAFDAARAEGRAALVTYIMGGDPDLATARALALACVEGGTDLLEIGVPFSDPIADGPVIQLAAERALAAGTTLAGCLELAAAIRQRGVAVPIALMGYVNPVLAYGEERFVRDCARAGVDALIIPDLLPEEATGLRELAQAQGLGMVFLVAPTSTAERRTAVAEAATAFVYVVSVTGVTGVRQDLPTDLGELVASVRAESRVPVVIGFGVSRPDQAKTFGSLADGVVVGSAIVSRIAEPGTRQVRTERVRKFVASLARALRGR